MEVSLQNQDLEDPVSMETVKIPNRKLEHTLAALRELLNADTRFKVSYAALRTKKSVDKAYGKLFSDRAELLLKFCKSKNGAPVLDDEKQIQWYKNGEKRFTEAVEKLLAGDSEIRVHQIPFEHAFGPEDRVKGAIIADLEFMFPGLYEGDAAGEDESGESEGGVPEGED